MTGPAIAVVDYGIGNLRSACKALSHLGADARLTDSPAEIEAAAGVVLPGVGAFGRCMEALTETGLDGSVRQAVAAGVPFLGICVGMQMLYEGSDEAPDVPGLGLIAGRIELLPDGVKRPQMQWNKVTVTRPSRVLDVAADRWMYFVHSYAAPPSEATAATCTYGTELTAAVDLDPLWATQFHPEKSGADGLAVLDRFVGVCR